MPCQLRVMEYKVRFPNLVKEIDIKGGKVVDEDSKLLYSDGIQRGYDKGFAEGREVGRSEIKVMKDRLLGMIDAFLNEKGKFLSSLEPNILRLIKVIAEKVIVKELKTDPNIILEVVREGLKHVSGSDKILIKVNPTDYEVVQAIQSEWPSILPFVNEFKLVGDDKVSIGGCLIETTTGTVDATIESKIAKVCEILNLR